MPQSLRRLEHEYSLAAELEPAWAAKPLALTRHEGRPILVLVGPWRSRPLDGVLERDRQQPLDLARLLRLAINLATALGYAHQRGLIHKDVKPENVLVDDVGHVWLTGFGIASRLPRERQPPAPPEVVVGTLAYMSPEQAGRWNARPDPFPLGADDSSDRLLTREKLYGREREVNALVAAFDRVVAHGTEELLEHYGSLSLRGRQVMALVVSGLLNKQAGSELGISEITVKAHRGRMMQKIKALFLRAFG